MGSKGDKSFFDRFTEGLGQVILVFLLFWLVWYIFNSIIETIQCRRWDRVLKLGVVIFMFWTLSKCTERENRIHESKLKETQDNRSGYEIWKENMKDYDAERGY